MLLAVDIGNSTISTGLFGLDGELRFLASLDTDYRKTADQICVDLMNLFQLYHFRYEDVTDSILCSVVPPLNFMMEKALTRLLGKPPVVVGPGVKTGLNIRLAVQSQVGADIVADAVSALEQFTAPIITIDMGTATTVTAVDADGAFRGGAIIPGKSGVQFDVETAKEIIGDGSQASYSIPVTITQPTITEAVLRERLFRDTLARTATNLNEGNAPRTNNVRLAAKAINGTILNPGDVFSYNTVVGERTQARGYQEAHAYSGGKIIDEFGGGVCQPSSTLYMAVLRADLEVVERHNHSFTVSYTPLGEDATVDYGNLDFRFANNTAYPIKILAEQTDGQMIMTIIGTKTSDKTVATRTEVLETYKPETVEKQDSSLAAGETQVETSGITGYSTRTYKVITENGKTTEVLANKSTYSKRDEVVSVGTGS